eukprot:GILJ01004786.1.p1 GENE.GILJ01004786.1~~GILJ01004786.1.p1  ORF type:complete len:265 (-),score=18.16 GILJ01004786.1:183-977(-)
MTSRSAGMQMRPATTATQTRTSHPTVSPRPLHPPQARAMHAPQSYSEEPQQQQPPYGPPDVQIPPHAPVFQEVRHLVGGLGHVVELLWAGQQSVHMLSHSTGHLGQSLLSLPAQLWNIIKAILTFRYLRDLASGASSKLVSSSSANALDAIYHGSIGSTGMAVESTAFLTASSSFSLSRLFPLLNRFVVPLGLLVIVTLLIREKRRLQRALARERLQRQSKQTDTPAASSTAPAPAAIPPQLVSDSHAAGPALLSAPRPRTSIQ